MRSTGTQSSVWNNAIRSMLLLALFPFFLQLLSLAFALIYFAVTIGMSGKGDLDDAGIAAVKAMPTFLPYVLGATAVWFVIAYFANTRIMSSVTGARPIGRREAPELYNLLENLSISQGMQMPKLEVIDDPALNAYASGVDKDQYTVTVTTGLMDALEPDELEAVLAHELAHIKHGDVSLMVIGSIFVGIFALIYAVVVNHFDTILRGAASSSDGKKGGVAQLFWALMIGFIVILVVRFLSLATLMAISRGREYMADMTAVMMTRNPDAMARALHRISGNSAIEGTPDSVRAMMFENDFGSFLGLLSTHPPIEKRIAALEKHAGANLASAPSAHNSRRVAGPSFASKPTNPVSGGQSIGGRAFGQRTGFGQRQSTGSERAFGDKSASRPASASGHSSIGTAPLFGDEMRHARGPWADRE